MSDTGDRFWEEYTYERNESMKKGIYDFLSVYKTVGSRFGHYMMPPPNDFVFNLEDLRFGKRDYEVCDIPEYGWTRFKKPMNWRAIVGDPWAMFRICENFEGAISGGKNCYVYDPFLLEEMLCKHPDVVRAVKKMDEAKFRSFALKPLMVAASTLFRSDYRIAYEARMKQPENWSEYAYGAYSDAPWDARWKQACKQFDKAIDLICMFITRHYTLYPEKWSASLATHVNLSAYYKYFTGSKTFFSRPKMVRRSTGVSDGKPTDAE